MLPPHLPQTYCASRSICTSLCTARRPQAPGLQGIEARLGGTCVQPSGFCCQRHQSQPRCDVACERTLPLVRAYLGLRQTAGLNISRNICALHAAESGAEHAPSQQLPSWCGSSNAYEADAGWDMGGPSWPQRIDVEGLRACVRACVGKREDSHQWRAGRWTIAAHGLAWLRTRTPAPPASGCTTLHPNPRSINQADAAGFR